MTENKYLAVDFGLKRVGIAVSDTGGRMAFVRPALAYGDKERFWREMLARIRDEAPQGLVVGLPLLPDGTDSLTTRQIRNFTARLKRRVSLPVFFMAEELSSHEAAAMLQETGVQDIRKRLDSAAAARILESFLAQPIERRISA